MHDTSITLLESLVDQSDQQAWENFFAAYAPRMQDWLVRRGVGPELAFDIRQEAMQIVIEEVSEFRHNDQVGASRCWIDRIVQNAWRRIRQRKSSIAVEAEMLDQLKDDDSEFSRLLREDYAHYGAKLIEQELENLREECQPHTIEAFVETTILGNRIEVTATKLSMTRGSVATARSRVRAKLRDRIQGILSAD